MKSFMKEFRDFINRGNVLDMAVGIIIGGAFTAIVSSLTSDIISSILGLFGGLNFDKYAFTFGEVTIGYGKFITAVINFLIMAFVVFCIVKAMNKASSRLNTVGGAKDTLSSEPEARIFVSFFDFVTLTTKSLSFVCSPTTCPAYTSSPGAIKKRPRDCKLFKA